MRRAGLSVFAVAAVLIAVIGYWLWNENQKTEEQRRVSSFTREFILSAYGDTAFYKRYIRRDERAKVLSQRNLMNRSFKVSLIEDPGFPDSCCWQYVVTYPDGNMSYLDVHTKDGNVDWGSADTYRKK